AINPQVRASGDKIELDVADESPAQILIPNDPTVRKIEVSSGAHARATLQIKHSAKTTELLARATKVSENGEDLVLVIPRESKYATAKLTAESVSAPQPPAAVAATGTVPRAAAAPVTVPAPAPTTAPALPPPPTTPPPPPAATAAATPTPPAPAPAAALAAPAPAAQPPLQLAESPRLPMGSIAVIILFGGAGAFFFWRKRRARGIASQAKHTIDVL